MNYGRIENAASFEELVQGGRLVNTIHRSGVRHHLLGAAYVASTAKIVGSGPSGSARRLADEACDREYLW